MFKNTLILIFRVIISHMNFLAHIYLSGNSTEILIGNFIGDYVKGKAYRTYPEGVRKGILMHRKIDSFTDKHPITRSSKTYVRDQYGKYSGIVVDIFYDHFLSLLWDRYSGMPLKDFAKDRYKKLDSGYSFFPEGVKKWFPFFIKSNWLESYSSFDGLSMVFTSMAHRTTLPDHSDYAVNQLRVYYKELKSCFQLFFDEICKYVQIEFDIRLDQGSG